LRQLIKDLRLQSYYAIALEFIFNGRAYGQSDSDAHGQQKFEILGKPQSPIPWKFRADHRGDKRSSQHAMDNRLFKRRSRGI
jgi:hypothetical protein